MYGTKVVKNHGMLSASWVVGCLLMSSFTLLSANKVEDVDMM